MTGLVTFAPRRWEYHSRRERQYAVRRQEFHLVHRRRQQAPRRAKYLLGKQEVRGRVPAKKVKCVGICNEKGISCEMPEKLSGYLQVQARWWVRRKKDEHRRRTWKAEPLEAWRQGSASVYGEERLSRKRERCKSKVAFLKYK